MVIDGRTDACLDLLFFLFLFLIRFLQTCQGAGKTQTLLWLRKFFEEVCGWSHGQEFVFCASQNTMTALINGVTLHSFFGLVFMNKDGRKMNVQNEDKADMSHYYIRFQALRFLFIDEFSTAAIEWFAEINHKTTTHIRENNTWSLRKEGETISHRPFGGLNLVVSGDAWQFGPVGAGAVFDDPFKTKFDSASNKIISEMFWKKEEDSFNQFLELTVERRCKDRWLS